MVHPADNREVVRSSRTGPTRFKCFFEFFEYFEIIRDYFEIISDNIRLFRIISDNFRQLSNDVESKPAASKKLLSLIA